MAAIQLSKCSVSSFGAKVNRSFSCPCRSYLLSSISCLFEDLSRSLLNYLVQVIVAFVLELTICFVLEHNQELISGYILI